MRPTLRIWVPSNRTRDDGSPAPMDGLNEIIATNRTGWQVGQRIERENVQWVATFVRIAMRRTRYRAMTRDDRQVCDVHVCVHEVSKARDVANVYGGVLKYALDALTARHKYGAGAIWDDNSTWLRYLTPSIVIDKEHPGLEIAVIPIKESKEKKSD